MRIKLSRPSPRFVAVSLFLASGFLPAAAAIGGSRMPTVGALQSALPVIGVDAGLAAASAAPSPLVSGVPAAAPAISALPIVAPEVPSQAAEEPAAPLAAVPIQHSAAGRFTGALFGGARGGFLHPAASVSFDGAALEPGAAAALLDKTGGAVLSPSLVQRRMAQVYQRYPEPDARTTYARYIEPLRDARAKRMLHSFLIYAAEHPERMSALPYEQAREHLVEAANRLSADNDPADAAGLSAAISLYAAELAALRPSPAAVPAAQAAAVPAKPAIAFSGGLDYFPGWPEIREEIGDERLGDQRLADLLRDGRIRLVKDKGAIRSLNDEKAYDVYIDQELGGRFTVRRYAGRVERSILFTYRDQLSTYGRSDGSIDDMIRRAGQQWDRFLARFKR